MPSNLGVVASGVVTAPWTPANLGPDLYSWFDASDAATITASSGKVSQWADKSPRAKHLAQGTSSRQPQIGVETLNGKNVLSFNGTVVMSGSQAADWTFLGDGTNYIIGMVCKIGATSNPDARYGILSTHTGGAHGLAFNYDDRSSLSRNNWLFTVIYGQGQATAPVNVRLENSWTPNVSHTFSGLYKPTDATAANRGNFQINAGAASTSYSTTDAIYTATAPIALGVGWELADTNFLFGTVAEIVLAVGASATDANRLLLRDYLRAKWGTA